MALSMETRRLREYGFDLDLTYILPNVIAMRYPAERASDATYSNDIREVARFLDMKHGDRYFVFNLVPELRPYDPRFFHSRVSYYQFADCNSPPITMMVEFCDEAQAWLSRNPRNVIVVHCHAGLGRTGTMISTYLLFSGMFRDARKATDYFEKMRLKRTSNLRPMQPSQYRYVRYFERLIRLRFAYRPQPLMLCAVEFSNCPWIKQGQLICKPVVTVSQADCEDCLSKPPVYSSGKKRNSVLMEMQETVCVNGDFKLTFYERRTGEMLFWIWLNTFFVGIPDENDSSTSIKQKSEYKGPRLRCHSIKPGDSATCGPSYLTPAGGARITVSLKQKGLDVFCNNTMVSPNIDVNLYLTAVG